MKAEPLEHGQAWREAGRRCDDLAAEAGSIARMLDDLAEEALVAIGHARFIGRSIDRIGGGL